MTHDTGVTRSKARAARDLLALLAALVPAAIATVSPACATNQDGARVGDARAGVSTSRPAFPPRPERRASAEFNRVWRDGRAEMSGYRMIVPRYGALRPAELVLIYVTEPMDRRTWIKDDNVPAEHRVDVLKLNISLKFETGIYPYSVLTSVFAPIDAYGGDRFRPTKITMSAQEWCGHVFSGVWPGRDRFAAQTISYFASEGERSEIVRTPEDALYEDALLIQLRELDGPFARGGDWRGAIVPSLWRVRRGHVEPRATDATIARSSAELDGVPVTRFVLRDGDYQRTFDVERAAPRRIVHWTSSDGEDATLLRTARLRYWEMNGPGGEAHRTELGLPPLPEETVASPDAGATRVGF